MRALTAIAALAVFAWMVGVSAAKAESRWQSGATQIQLTASGDELPDRGWVVAWIDAAVADISGYLGRFPVERLHVHVSIRSGVGGILGGQQFAGTPPRIEIALGALTERHQFHHDWVLTHEVAHLAMPPLDRRHRWAEEGLATYVESIARMRRGRLEPQQVWRGFARQMPGGLAAAAPTGLDGRRDWSSVYWGGAAFFLLADVRLRARSAGRVGLEHALAALNQAGGHQGAAEPWSIQQVVGAADRTMGLPVLEPLYREWGRQPFTYPMAALFARLGVASAGTPGAATLTGIRRGIQDGVERVP